MAPSISHRAGSEPGNGCYAKMRYDCGMGILYLLLPYILQGTAIVHCIKAGRNWLWIWVLIWPGIGAIAALAYIAIEILPDLFRSRTAQRTARGLKRAVDPFADLRRYENEARLAGNVASRQRYAEELERHGLTAYATVVDGHPVTAVGEVPPVTVRFIASSVQARPSAH